MGKMVLFKSCIAALLTKINFDNLLYENMMQASTGLMSLLLIRFLIGGRTVYAFKMNTVSDIQS